MASDPINLTESGITIPSDSENYDGNNELSPSPPSSSSTPLILYKPPTLWGLIRGAAINLLLPFINGLMLGFGELVANEAAYRLGWSGTKVGFPLGILYMLGLIRCTDISYSPFGDASRRSWRGDACRSHRAEAEEWARDGHVHVIGVKGSGTSDEIADAPCPSVVDIIRLLYIGEKATPCDCRLGVSKIYAAREENNQK